MSNENKKKHTLKQLIFNIIETIIFFEVGLLFKVNINIIIMLMVIFFFTRKLIGSPKHYATAYRCFIWSLLIFVSLFLITDLKWYAILALTICTGYLATGKADITDMYQWKGNSSNYKALIDVIAIAPNHPIIIEHEKYWFEKYPMRYEIFRMFFRERMTYEEIVKEKGLDSNQIIQKECRIIYNILELPLNLPSVE